MAEATVNPQPTKVYSNTGFEYWYDSLQHDPKRNTLNVRVGNFSRDEASDFLKSFADVLSPVDRMIVGLDACNDPARV